MKQNKTNNKDKNLNNKEIEVTEETKEEKVDLPKETKTEIPIKPKEKPKQKILEEVKPDGTIHRYVWVKSASGELIKHTGLTH
jgi:hypothetical protein